MILTRAGSQPSAKGPAEYFTGNARIDAPSQATAPERAGGATVTFEPGARTARHTHPLGQLAAIIACQALREYRVMLGAALAAGVTPVEVKEIVYQAVAYVGMAKVFDFIHATNEVLTERGIALPLPGQSTTTPENRAEKGLAIQKEIIGSDVVESLYKSAPKDQLHIQHYPSSNCFGDNYTRTGFDVKTRELLTFSMLVALGGCEPQVKGHVAANVRCGNDRDEAAS